MMIRVDVQIVTADGIHCGGPETKCPFEKDRPPDLSRCLLFSAKRNLGADYKYERCGPCRRAKKIKEVENE